MLPEESPCRSATEPSSYSSSWLSEEDDRSLAPPPLSPSPTGDAVPWLTASRYLCSSSDSVVWCGPHDRTVDQEAEMSGARIINQETNNSPEAEAGGTYGTWRWLLRWYSVSPDTAIALITDLGVASAMFW